MKSFVRYIVLLMALICTTSINAQIDVNIDINEMIRDAQSKMGNTKVKVKKQKKLKQIDLSFPKIDAFSPIEDSMKMEEEYSIGAFGFTWGDPVANPRIRRNTANNLYGQVRYNTDGSKRWHHGFDYYAPIGTPVMSVGEGVIESTGKSTSYGIYVQIKHERGGCTYYSFYAHLKTASVKAGQAVLKGSVIGESGTSGNASNLHGEDEHVHFEYRIVPQSGRGHQANPNAIVRTKFYSADPDNPYQSEVEVIKGNQ